ncbi:restriction endonuclease subunit S [Methylobacterium sp. yr596]|uniref:restriction endonuclease subunit S n=1 Tax=Methylobacterium sp. yr596 TaxID=1761800 RepID=UPI0008F402DD|nr:restriction endonuclease subunit S [Methylobacterium sp. yr596]SFF63799.1 type I restriction enzyme, S subunit [Methylobacterium sp. yr596]
MLRPFEPDTDYPIDVSLLPKRWLVTTVGAVISDVRNGFGTSHHNTTGNGTPHLRPMNITKDGNISIDHIKYVNETHNLIFQRGDIAFNNTNSAELVGKSAIFDQSEDWTFSNHITRLRVISPISTDFIAFQLQHLWRQGYLRQRSTQHVSQASINNRTLTETVPLVIAPAGEQVLIAAELKRRFAHLESVVKAVDSARSKLREYEKLVVISAATGKLVPTEAELARAEGRAADDGYALLKELADLPSSSNFPGNPHPSIEAEDKSDKYGLNINSNSDLPEGWVWARVEQVGSVTLGRKREPKQHTGEHMRPYLRVANVFEDRIDTNSILEMNFTPSEFLTYKLEYGDILLNEGQSPDLVGRAAMYRNEVPGVCFQMTLIRFRAYPGVSPGYALLVFRAYLHLGKFREISRWTTNIAHLSAGRFANLEFPLPPLAEQERIVAEASRRLDIAQLLTTRLNLILERVDAARSMALSHAFTGRLVERFENNEDTAAELIDEIEKIKAASNLSTYIKGAAMRKQPETRKGPRTSLLDVLAAAEGPLTPEELLARSGVGEDLIEDFFFRIET